MREGLEKKADSFEKQFNSHVSIPLSEAESIELTKISPENLEDETVIVLAEAFAHTKPVYEHTLRAFYEGGRATAIFEHPRTNAPLVLNDQDREIVKDLLETNPEEVRSALTMIRSIERGLGGKPVDVLAHSRGLSYVTIAQKLRPDLFRDTVVYGGAGLIGEDGPFASTWRTLQQGRSPAKWDKVPLRTRIEMMMPGMKKKRLAAEKKGFLKR